MWAPCLNTLVVIILVIMSSLSFVNHFIGNLSDACKFRDKPNDLDKRMPKKRDNSPAADHPQFVERLIKCIGGPAASKRDFAIRAGILPSTFNNYFKSVEPARDTLIKIARTAGVGVGWLVDGSADSQTDKKAEIQIPDAELAQLRRNLAFVLQKPRLLTSVPKRTGISEDRLRSLCRNEIPTGEEMERLASVWSEPVLRTMDIASFEEEVGFRMLPQKPGENPFAELARKDPANSVHRVGQLVDAIISLVGERNVYWHAAKDDVMAPTIQQSSLAVAIRRDQPTGSGVYLFKNDNREFIARLTVTPDHRLLLTFDNPEHRRVSETEFDPATHHCIGPVMAIIQRIGKPSEE